MRSTLALLLLSFFSSYHAGFAPGTHVLSSQGFICIDQLQKKSRIISYGATTKAITRGAVRNHSTYISSQAYRVICDSGISFIASPDQYAMCYISQTWIAVKNLKTGDTLACYNNRYITVNEVEIIHRGTRLVEISVSPPHTFFITPVSILVHNNPIAVFAVAPAIVSVVSKVMVTGIIGSFLWNIFSKKKKIDIRKNIQQQSFSDGSLPSPKKPDDEDEFKKKHPHGSYEDVGYHKNHQSGRKSPRPIDGQNALDNSYLIEGQNRHRISVSNGEIVVLYETGPKLYHGHVRTWTELTKEMRNTLIYRGLTSIKGKFLK